MAANVGLKRQAQLDMAKVLTYDVTDTEYLGCSCSWLHSNLGGLSELLHKRKLKYA